MTARLPDNEDEHRAVRGQYHLRDTGPKDACDDTASLWFRAITGLDVMGTAHDLASGDQSIRLSDALYIISPLPRQIIPRKWGMRE